MPRPTRSLHKGGGRGHAQAASNAGENHVLARSHSTKREREMGRATTERRAVLSSDCEIVCGGAVGRSDQILEYIARSIEEETPVAEGWTEGKEFAGWGD